MRVGMIIGVSIVTLVIALTAMTAMTAMISGLGVRCTRDFTVAGKRVGWPIASGVIVGALVGDSSNVRTAQAAFVSGLPAWWFTVGAGLACMVLGTIFVQPLRRTGAETLPQYLVTSFEQPIRTHVAICDSIGIFITIPGQAASAITLLAVLLQWSLPPVIAPVALISRAASRRCGKPPWRSTSAFSERASGRTSATVSGSRSECSTTQVYVQAVPSGRDARQARAGAMVAGFATTIFGFGGVAVGMFMRVHEPSIAAAQALPLLAAHFFSPILIGVMLRAILITVIACAGSLALGTHDLYQHYLQPQMGDLESLIVARSVIVMVMLAGVLIGASDGLKLIISYSFLAFAFAFRADAMLIPVIVAVMGSRTNLRSAGAGIGALVRGMVTDIVRHLVVVPGGAAVFAGHAISGGAGGRKTAVPSVVASK